MIHREPWLLSPWQKLRETIGSRSRLRRLGQWLRFGLSWPRKFYRFYIVSAEYNAGFAVLNCLNSVAGQNYDRQLIHHILIDDASTDGTDGLIENWLQQHPSHRVTYLRNLERFGLCANNVRGFRMAEPGAIVLELNGDDWLSDRKVLSFLNKIYANENIWMTYNTFRHLKEGNYVGIFRRTALPPEVIKSNSFREYRWSSSHLHSFRAELFSHVRNESLVDPATGQFWTSAVDQAIYLPLLELAGSHSLGISRIMYTYNMRSSSHELMNPAGQMDNARRIRQMEKYQPLAKLTLKNIAY
jgi:glycosyltransferase involved in cell wall biosynthesis